MSKFQFTMPSALPVTGLLACVEADTGNWVLQVTAARVSTGRLGRWNNFRHAELELFHLGATTSRQTDILLWKQHGFVGLIEPFDNKRQGR